MKITTVGLDIAKSIFHLFAVNKMGRYVKKKQLKRAQLLHFFAQLEPCVIAMEACGGANYWAREMIAVGHEVKLIAPQYDMRLRLRAFILPILNDAIGNIAVLFCCEQRLINGHGVARHCRCGGDCKPQFICGLAGVCAGQRRTSARAR